jgi:hypothetical protein
MKVTWPTPRSDPDRPVNQRPRAYRLAWYRNNPRSPYPFGPPFGSVEEAQRAAGEVNNARRLRGQESCNCILEYDTRPNDRGTIGRKRTMVLRMKTLSADTTPRLRHWLAIAGITEGALFRSTPRSNKPDRFAPGSDSCSSDSGSVTPELRRRRSAAARALAASSVERISVWIGSKISACAAPSTSTPTLRSCYRHRGRVGGVGWKLNPAALPGAAAGCCRNGRSRRSI